MAYVKISALSAAASVALTDEFEVNQGGTSAKATASQIIAAAFVNTAPTLGWYSPSADLIRTPNSVTIDDTLTVDTAVSTNTTATVFNTVATTVNAFGAATTLALGASTGTATIANATITFSNATTVNVNGSSPTIASTSTGTLTLFNTNITTVNAFGAATTLRMAASGGAVGIGVATLGYEQFRVGGTFTSSGASTIATGINYDATLAGAAGDTTYLAQLNIVGSVNTQGNTDTIAVVASARFAEPNITVGTGDTITAACTVYVPNAPTEGGTNYAFFVDSGSVRLDGSLWVESTPTEGTAGEQLTSEGAATVMQWTAAACIAESKRNIERIINPDFALQAIVATPIYSFRYRDKMDGGQRRITTGDTDTDYVGPMAHEAPWAMHHAGRILNPINAFGYTILGLQALDKRISALEAKG